MTTTSAVGKEVTQFAEFLEEVGKRDTMAQNRITLLVGLYLPFLEEGYDLSTYKTIYSGPLMAEDVDVALRKKWLRLELLFRRSLEAFQITQVKQRHQAVTNEDFPLGDFVRFCPFLESVELNPSYGMYFLQEAGDTERFQNLYEATYDAGVRGEGWLGDKELANIVHSCKRATRLTIWHGNFTDLSPLAKLTDLTELHLGSLCQVPKNVKALCQLPNLDIVEFSVERERIYSLSLEEEEELQWIAKIPQLTCFATGATNTYNSFLEKAVTSSPIFQKNRALLGRRELHAPFFSPQEIEGLLKRQAQQGSAAAATTLEKTNQVLVDKILGLLERKPEELMGYLTKDLMKRLLGCVSALSTDDFKRLFDIYADDYDPTLLLRRRTYTPGNFAQFASNLTSLTTLRLDERRFHEDECIAIFEGFSEAAHCPLHDLMIDGVSACPFNYISKFEYLAGNGRPKGGSLKRVRIGWWDNNKYFIELQTLLLQKWLEAEGVSWSKFGKTWERLPALAQEELLRIHSRSSVLPAHGIMDALVQRIKKPSHKRGT